MRVDLGRERNDKPDLNEAFFVSASAARRSARARGAPLRRTQPVAGGPSGFRDACSPYTDAVTRWGAGSYRSCATALDLPADTFDGAFAESQFSFRLTTISAVTARQTSTASRHTPTRTS